MHSLMGVRDCVGFTARMACVRPKSRCSYCLYPPQSSTRILIACAPLNATALEGFLCTQ
jgi:hypothetical protein